ncbi:MAG: type II toxin-antitoxin system HicA family toxin [Planctomycetaceae bacterium]|nr:type II toxin-antitoxin system HicA family toxin [Planctomycetaceae bacterium]
MNSKHQKTLKAIFAKPEPKAMVYRDVESLMRALGFAVKEREGSRIAFIKDGAIAHLHRPHPGKEIKGYQIKGIREVLIKLGMQP